MWILFFLGFAQAIVCPVPLTLLRSYDLDLLSFDPAPCPSSGFERYGGSYTVVSSSNPNVAQTSCSLGPAQYLFDNQTETAWNSGSSPPSDYGYGTYPAPAFMEKSTRKGDKAGSLAPTLDGLIEATAPYVIFQTLKIKPVGMSFTNYGDTTHDTKAATLSYADAPTGPWVVARSLVGVVGSSDEQFFPLKISQSHKYWKFTVTPPSGGVFYGRDFKFYINPFPIRLLPSLGDFPNTYYPLDGSTGTFDNSTATYQEFQAPYAVFLFYFQTYLNVDVITGVMWQTNGTASQYGISEYSLRPLEEVLMSPGVTKNFRYGTWNASKGATEAFGAITNWEVFPTFTFVFTAKPASTASHATLRLAELQLVGCPNYCCPCKAVTGYSGLSTVQCSGTGSPYCTMIDKPFVPLGA